MPDIPKQEQPHDDIEVGGAAAQASSSESEEQVVRSEIPEVTVVDDEGRAEVEEWAENETPKFRAGDKVNIIKAGVCGRVRTVLKRWTHLLASTH
ncbi:hypothetical protein PG993_014905 [Apiospora rasikravindrae]|uniref:Hypervirulence associated protein TUDOR domain-containing protein n=1 Tax=Apiospora rasikravindrae TaxID=990691 RepID=A0ABR1RQ97_9PEZI